MVDFLIIIVLAILTFIGYKKGFFKTVVGLLSLAISLILSMFLSVPISKIFVNAPGYSAQIISGIIIFIALRVAISVLIKVFGFIKKLPLIGTFDGALGAALGFAKGVLIIYLLMIIVELFASFNIDSPVVQKVNQSQIAKIVYNNNVFVDFIHKD